MKEISAILLKKSLKSVDEKHWEPSNSTHWIALGHFDDMYVYDIDESEENGFFARIKKDKEKIFAQSDESVYYHPLYLIPDISNLYANDYSNNFIAIVRIHFPASIKLTTQFDHIKKAICRELKQSDLSYRLYYATEFSDMVLDVRSKTLNILIEKVLRLREIKDINIGKTYTYFGISSNLIYSDDDMEESNDIIPFLSMRFSGYNTKTIRQQMKLIKKCMNLSGEHDGEEYCTNGIDDVMLIYKNKKSSSLVNLYKKLLRSDEYRDYRKPESVTKVGVYIDIESTNYQEFSPDSDLISSKICSELSDLCRGISESLKSKQMDLGWFHAISEVAHSLVRMSKTPIMDEVIYLIAPGVRAFLLNIIDMIEKKEKDELLCSEHLYEFVEKCSYFSEQLMRIEGQLSHNPEIRPVIYDIPVFMLEYIVAFLNKCSKILKFSDADKKYLHTEVMLIPHPCEIASAQEIFPATDKITGLVCIQIPESDLYNPKKTLRALCHEISHYVGELLRNREKRKKSYIMAFSALLIDKVYASNNVDLRCLLEEYFTKFIRDKKTPTIREMHEMLFDKAYKKICVNDSMEKIYHELFAQENFDPEAISELEFFSDENIELSFRYSFRDILNDVDILFREVFADVCMLFILDIDTSKYIESLLEEIAAHPNKQNNSEIAFAVRIYSTLTAMEREISYNSTAYESEWRSINDYITKMDNEIQNEVVGTFNLEISTAAVWALKAYAKECFNSIKKIQCIDKLIDIRKMYDTLDKENFEYKNVIKEIEKYREDVLQKYKAE